MCYRYDQIRPDNCVYDYRPVPVNEVTLSDWLSVLTQLCSPTSHTTDGSASGSSVTGGFNIDENCPVPDMAKLAADTMYTNFIELYNYLSAPNE